MQAIRGGTDQLPVIRKHTDDPRRHQLAKQEPQRSHSYRPAHRQPGHVRHPGIESGTIIITGYRLHALIKSHDNHHEKKSDTVHYTISANRHISPMLFQSPVDKDHDQAGTKVHQERR